MVVLDTTIVNVALPSIQTASALAPAASPWVVNGYALTFGALLLLGGAAGDLLGRRNVFVAALGVFAVASMLGGLARQPQPMLIAARVLQGAGAAILSPPGIADRHGHVQGGSGAQQGAGHLRRDRRRLRRRRRGARSAVCSTEYAGLALDLLRQRADRPGGRWALGAAAGSRKAGLEGAQRHFDALGAVVIHVLLLRCSSYAIHAGQTTPAGDRCRRWGLIDAFDHPDRRLCGDREPLARTAGAARLSSASGRRPAPTSSASAWAAPIFGMFLLQIAVHAAGAATSRRSRPVSATWRWR